MELWLISQEENNGYDTFDSAVVAAETEDDARNIVPSHFGAGQWGEGSWCSGPDKVFVHWIGTAKPDMEEGVIMASFNAG